MNYPGRPNDPRTYSYESDSDSEAGWESSYPYSRNRAHRGRFSLHNERSAPLRRLSYENIRHNFNNFNERNGDGYSVDLDFPPRGRRTARYDSYDAYGARPAAYRPEGRTYPEYIPTSPLRRRPAGFDSFSNFGPRRYDDRIFPTGAYSDGGFSDDLSGYGGDRESFDDDDLFPSRDDTFYRPGGAQRGQGARGFGGGMGMGGRVGMGGYGVRGGRNRMAAPFDSDTFRREPEPGLGRYPGARFDPDAFPRRNPVEGGNWGARGVLQPDEIEEA